MDGLQKAIKLTKKYAGKYGQILNNDQLFLRLISPKKYRYSDFLGQKKIGVSNKVWQQKVLLATDLVVKHLSKMKGIKMVGITGTVAAEAAKKNEDIDLLIITDEAELWWWRLYLRFYVWCHGIPHRKFGEKEKSDEYCFNLWLDTANLEIPRSKQNLKNATDLIMMKVIWDKDGSYVKFLGKNQWVKKFLATGYKERIKISREVDKEVNRRKNKKNNFVKKIVNNILFWGQYAYMWSKTGNDLKNIRSGQAFFHKNN
ncbi:MAG: hypothetical protein WC503_01275 [Candidatus Shapirobacteria bacterium]